MSNLFSLSFSKLGSQPTGEILVHFLYVNIVQEILKR